MDTHQLDQRPIREYLEHEMGHLLKLIEQELGVPFELPKLASEQIDFLYAVAYHFYQNGKYEKAQHFFRFLTGVDVSNRQHWMGLGATLQMMQFYQEAAETYGFAALLDENDKDPLAHVYAADCFFALKQIESGMQALKSAEIIAKKTKNKRLLDHISLIRETWKDKKIN